MAWRDESLYSPRNRRRRSRSERPYPSSGETGLLAATAVSKRSVTVDPVAMRKRVSESPPRQVHFERIPFKAPIQEGPSSSRTGEDPCWRANHE
jgi:hypothetical protein